MENNPSNISQTRYHRIIHPLASTLMENVSSDDQVERLGLLINAVAQRQDKTAFSHLFTFFMPKIRAFGLQRLGQQGLAMDLVQETMTSVWTKSHLYNPEKGAVTTWVFTIMRNQCFDMLRRVQHNKEDAYGDDIWPLFEAPQDNESNDDFKLSGKLLENVDKLPPLQRQVVHGIYLQELSQQELADKLNVPIGTVKSRLRLGLEKLKSFLEKHYD